MSHLDVVALIVRDTTQRFASALTPCSGMNAADPHDSHRRTRRQATPQRVSAFGVALSIVHILFAALITYSLQPYVPVSAYGYEQALRISLPFLLGVDPLVYGLIVVGGTAVTAYDRARALELRKSQLEVEVARAQ